MAIGPGEPTFHFNQQAVVAQAPATSGVYCICNAQGGYLYFGESDNIQRRLQEHLNDANHAMHRHGAATFAFEAVAAHTRVARQNALIALHRPVCNQMFG